MRKYVRSIVVAGFSIFVIAGVGYAATYNITSEFGENGDTFVTSGKVINRQLKVNKWTRLKGKLTVDKNAYLKGNAIVTGNVNIKDGNLIGVGADDITYDNTSSGLTAETTQAAVDELVIPTLSEAVEENAQWTPVVYDTFDTTSETFPEISTVDNVTLNVSFNTETNVVLSTGVNVFKPDSKDTYDSTETSDSTIYSSAYNIVGNSIIIYDGTASSYTLNAEILSDTQMVLTPSDTTDDRNLRRVLLTVAE